MIAAIGIGTNLGDKLANIQDALKAMSDFASVVSVSSVYLTAPWGVEDQPPFYNAAALIDVELSPDELLGRLKAVEQELGRTETFLWGPRLIDLDILYYGNLRVELPHLSIPHARMNERLFVLAPLSELDNSYSDLLDSELLSGQSIERIAGPEALSAD